MKLKIDLVPKSSWFSNLRSILTATEWNKIKKIVFSKHDHKCQICGGVGTKWPVECHEAWEYKDGVQKLIDLECLCPKCHKVRHFGLAELQGYRSWALNHLMTVNGITKDEAEQVVSEAFRVWAERSKQTWILNTELLVSILKEKA